MVDKAMAVRRQSAARRDSKVREFGDGGWPGDAQGCAALTPTKARFGGVGLRSRDLSRLRSGRGWGCAAKSVYPAQGNGARLRSLEPCPASP